MSCGGEKEHEDGSNKDRYNENYDKISKTVEELNALPIEPGMHKVTVEQGRELFHDLTRDWRAANGYAPRERIGELQEEANEWARRQLPIRMAYAMRDDAMRRTAVAEKFNAEQAGYHPNAIGEGYLTEHVNKITDPEDPRNGLWEVQRDYLYVTKTTNHTTGGTAYTVESSYAHIVCADPKDPGGTEFESKEGRVDVNSRYYSDEDTARSVALRQARQTNYVVAEEMEHQTRQLADRLADNGIYSDDYDISDPYDAEYDEYDEPGGMTDVEADADTLGSIGHGDDTYYGYYGDEGGFYEEY